MAQQHPDSVFDVLDNEFHRLIDKGFRIDCRLIDEALPQRQMDPTHLKAVLLHPSTSFDIRDAAWRYLIAQARMDGKWMTVALGMLQPGMRYSAGRIVRTHHADPEEVDSEFLTGVIEAVATINLEQSRLAGRLVSAGIDRARRAVLSAAAASGADPQAISIEPSHPEMALWRAVEEEVITAQDAELIATTRLDADTVDELAARFGMSSDTLLHRRYRAEVRIQHWAKRNF